MFQRAYSRGVLEGNWGVTLIFATGEHGDRDAPGWLKRITIALMWLFGVVLIPLFTANITPSLTVRQLQSSIRGPANLPGKAIVIRPDSVAAEYLAQCGMPLITVTSIQDARASGRARAIIFDAPTLRFLIHHCGVLPSGPSIRGAGAVGRHARGAYRKQVRRAGESLAPLFPQQQAQADKRQHAACHGDAA